MKVESKTKMKTYHSFDEFERVFFPEAHEQELSEDKSKKPKEFGTGLATELMEEIKRKLG